MKHLPQYWFAMLLVATSMVQLRAGDTNNPCLAGESYHIVVLGSSTAAGAGPSHPDSTWVNRYRRFLQSINPQNQVTNLAQGGTTTYQIMPDWFIPPPGRPATNTSRNISEAIRLNADAVIINMPSNDAANGFTLNEQMFNFSTMVSTADSAGIPVWVCTTQPRNFTAAKRLLQIQVKDSILSQFGSKAIDFWTTFADSLGDLDSAYDSGDGVHMNDAAHRILFQRVSAKNILSQLTDTLSKPDHFFMRIEETYGVCGLAEDSLWVNISNRGIQGNYDLPLRWRIEEVITGNVSLYYDTIFNGVATCDRVGRSLAFNTSSGGTWRISAHLETVNDSVAGNDHSDTLLLQREKPPLVMSQDGLACMGDSLILWAQGGDTVLWLDKNGSIVGYGDTLIYGPVLTLDSLMARAVRGPLHFDGTLFTHDEANISWNGIMFDLVASDTLSLDSLSLVPAQLQKTEVTVRTRNGSYKGFEADSSAWNLWGRDSVETTAANEFARVSFSPKLIYPGDTLGIYISMQNGRSLRYRSLSAEATYQDGPLELITGTGITYAYAGTYFPRAWSGEVYYHYGFNPRGNCSSDTLITVDIYPSYLDLGNDTLIDYTNQLALGVPAAYRNVTWSTGDTVPFTTVDSSMLAPGSNVLTVWVQATSPFNCVETDTMLVEFTIIFGLEDGFEDDYWKVYPNPVSDRLFIENPLGRKAELSLFNTAGQKVLTREIMPGRNELGLALQSGFYTLRISGYPYSLSVIIGD